MGCWRSAPERPARFRTCRSGRRCASCPITLARRARSTRPMTSWIGTAASPPVGRAFRDGEMTADLRTLLTVEAPAPGGHYSQGVIHGDTIYISGQLPITASGEHRPQAPL